MSMNRTTGSSKSQRHQNSLRDCGPATQLPVRATGLARCARLWALRIIAQGRNLHTFVQEDWFLHEELAMALGLDRLVSAEGPEFDRQAIRAYLINKYRLAERSCRYEDHSHPVLDVNIALLTNLFNLNRTEQDLLKFSVLAAYEGVLREACHFASLKDVPQILGHSHAATSAALSPKAALERSGLLTFNRKRDRSLHGAIELISTDFPAQMADMEVLAPAVATRAASLVRALPSIGAAGRSRALEHLIDNTLRAQGHGGLQRHSAQQVSEIYDPAFLHADADLTYVAQSLAGTGSGRLCLYGPPGTGKTAYGHWLAKRLEKPIVVRRASDLLSPYVGQAEQNIAAAFREAEHDGALLLIDEVDSFLLDRRQSVRSWETNRVNEMLTQIESFTGIFIASTNRMDLLDQAALRRFDLKVRLGYLQAQQALELLCRHCMLCDLSPPDPADIRALQRLHVLTPGDFAVVLRQNRLRTCSKSFPDEVLIAG